MRGWQGQACTLEGCSSELRGSKLKGVDLEAGAGGVVVAEDGLMEGQEERRC